MKKTVQEMVAEAKAQVPSISCKDYSRIEQSKEDHIVLDVREPAEYEAGHIEGAINIPRGVVEFKIEEAIPDHEKQIIICCASGGRAALAGKALREMGYSNLKFLEGGYSGYCAS